MPIERRALRVVSEDCVHACDFCPLMGYRQVTQGSAQGLFAKTPVFSCNTLHHPEVHRLLSEEGLSQIQINEKDVPLLNDAFFEAIKTRVSKVILIFSQTESIQSFPVDRFRALGIAVEAHFVVLDPAATRGLEKRHFDGFAGELFFRFPHTSSRPPSMTCDGVFDWIVGFQKENPGCEVQPPPGLDLFDSRVPTDFGLLTNHRLVHSAGNPADARVSVVIPVYDNTDYLLNTIRHLVGQDLPKQQFEVLVVDDGSPQPVVESLRPLVDGTQLNVKVIQFHRQKVRAMGDDSYRAGLARELGVFYSRGSLLLFLDSDILLPPHYLSRLIKEHERFDVLQPCRWQLTKKRSGENPQYASIAAEKKDTYDLPGLYWETFQRETNDWQRVINPWKFISTFCLSVKRQHFLAVGGFRHCYNVYGFEDTDLGYRLVRQGARLKLIKDDVFHLFHLPKRSEFRRSPLRKGQILSRSAKIFFLNNLDPEIHQSLSVFMGPSFMRRKLWGYFLKYLSVVYHHPWVRPLTLKTEALFNPFAVRG